MVIYCGWHRTAMDPNSSSRCLPISGEDTGLEALASPLVGYLGKVQGRADSLDCCPWCTSKGLTCALRSYRISLQDSITLCTNPQCLFPLVSRSLEDVLASLDPVEPAVGNKRKNASTQEKEELIETPFKRLRLSGLDSPGPQGVTGTHVGPAEHGAVNTIRNGQHAELETDGEKQNGYHRDCQIAKPTNWELLQEKDLDSAVHANGFAPSVRAASAEHSSEVLLTTDGDEPAPSSLCGARDVSKTELNHEMSPPGGQNACSSLDSKQNINSNEIYVSSSPQSEQKTSTEISRTEDCRNTGGVNSESEDFSGSSLRESEELVPVPRQLLWRNTDNLCWLDSLLAALFNCKSLRKCKPKDEPQRPSLWQLLKRYEDICAAVRVHQQTGSDGIVRVASHMLQKVTADLQILRMSVFKLLQPKLHCKLGQRETPVFAMPLLLLMDSGIEHLFRATFYWQFKCSQCQTTTKERVMKTLPTFTNIVPDWHPLNAAHLGPCNVCCKENQTRTMMLENVPPVFVLHFVGGLPSNDVSTYTFNFKGRNYSITTVIQYKSQLKHFVTWTCNADGSWLEYDDLKYPECRTHRKLQVPANEMHVVFWEEDVCSPSATCAVSPGSGNERSPSLNEESVADEVLACSPDQSPLLPHDDTDIVCALTEDTSSIIDTTVTAGADATIGASTLLDTFEGLTHSDIVTLTLVEVKPDVETQSLTNAHKREDLSAASRDEALDSRPDSSSAAECSELYHNHDVELLSTSSDLESGNGSSSDPTYVPAPKRGRGKGIGKGKPVTRGKAKKAVSSKRSPHMSPPPPSEPCDENGDQPVDAVAQDKSPAGEMKQQSSPMSSTDNSPLSTNLKDPTQSPVDQSARWSFLLSKYTHKVQKSTANIAPTSLTQIKPPPPPLHSTPNPLKRQQLPAAFCPKPQLGSEESEDLPVKAADMYGAFGAKSLNTQKPVLCPAVQSQPLTSKQLTNTAVMSSTSLTVPAAKGLPKISPIKKLGSHSSEVPLGLSTTEALRYKLIKKLKAKKKKLARLNEMLGNRGELRRRPDSTDLHSPSTVTSSTYDGSTCDDFLSDLLSPATTASNLSPDSTGFLEMLANGQDGSEQPEFAVRAAGTAPEPNGQDNEDFFSEFLSQVATHTPTAAEAEVLSELELFI